MSMVALAFIPTPATGTPRRSSSLALASYHRTRLGDRAPLLGMERLLTPLVDLGLRKSAPSFVRTP